jgi:lactoylglutathione lyase
MVYVDDVGRSRDFYRDVVGLSPLVDSGGYDEFAWWPLVLGLRQRASAARQLPGAVAPAGSGASHQFTVVVDDVDATVERLVGRGADVIHLPAD